MTDLTPNQTKPTALYVIIGILSVLLLGSFAYIYKLTNQVAVVEDSITLVTNEKEAVLKDLEATKIALDEAIATKSTISDELIAERDKVQKLIIDLKNTKNSDAASISKYKKESQILQAKIVSLIGEIDGLQKKNTSLTIQVDSTNTKLLQAKNGIDTLLLQNENLNKTVAIASKLTVLNLQSSALKQKSSGKQIGTDKASQADVLKISFLIAENKIAKSGDKSYYVQIIDSKNNVLGDKKTSNFEDKTLTYSFLATVKYDNKTVKVEKDLLVNDIQAGTFFVNVFDQSELISQSSFSLK